jgi:hypothetical protein
MGGMKVQFNLRLLFLVLCLVCVFLAGWIAGMVHMASITAVQTQTETASSLWTALTCTSDRAMSE